MNPITWMVPSGNALRMGKLEIADRAAAALGFGEWQAEKGRCRVEQFLLAASKEARRRGDALCRAAIDGGVAAPSECQSWWNLSGRLLRRSEACDPKKCDQRKGKDS